jgi:hypothetical protein
MCQNRPLSGKSKNVRNGRVSDVAAWCRTDCDEERVTANRQLLTTAVEMSTLARTNNAQFFYPYLKSCAAHRDTEKIVTLFKRISDECIIGRPGPAVLRVYTASMKHRFFYDADGELLIVPQLGSIRVFTELGMLGVGNKIGALEKPLAGIVLQVRPSAASPRLRWLCLAPAHQSGKDAQHRQAGAGQEGSLKAAHKGVLQRVHAGGREPLRLGRKNGSCRCAAKTEKDGSRQRHAQALPDRAPCCQDTRCRALFVGRRSPHDRPGIRRLKDALTNAGHSQTPDNIPNRTLGIKLAEQDQPRAGNCQPDR